MGILILSDLFIGILDITFLALMLLMISFYTKNNTPSFLLQFFSGKSPLWPIAVFFVLFTLKNLLGYLLSAAQSSFFYGVSSRLSKQNMWHYLKDDYINFITIDSSVLIRKISQKPIEFSNYILTNIQQVISQGILICCSIIGILFYHPSLFVLLFLLLLPPVIILGYFIRKKLRHIRTGIKITGEKSIQHLQESLTGYIESNIYDKNDFFVNRFYHYQEKLNENIAAQQTLQSLPSRLIEVFAILGFFILITINQWSAQSPFIDVLTIGIFMAAAYKIIPGIVRILNSTGQIKTYEFVLDDLIPLKEQDSKSILQDSEKISSIKFEQVGFSYKTHHVLRGFGFEMIPGDFIGISGKSGSGKTTIVNLVLGFLTENEGQVYINQQPLNSRERQKYRNRISYIKQQPFFINDSILKNITFSDDGYDTELLAEVLSFSGIDRMLVQYPKGVHQQITESGKNISGGQRQRIMLARALYHDFDLLILDEPFSEMDEAAEKEILVKLVSLRERGKMILMITHNKSSLDYCNQIIRL
jgi:ABC-type bacteriocin/lantibiotic exporter with double-glycine peptidase domain